MSFARAIYEFLLRLHPEPFRKQFQEQMMSTFDDSVESRGSASLILDGFLSLIRQWILRSRYWLNGSRFEIPADASVELVEWILQMRKAKHLHRKARRLNFAWSLGAVAVFLICPLPLERKVIFVFYLMPLFNLALSSEKNRIRKEERDDLSLSQEPHQTYRRWTEAKRDGLRLWSASLISPKNPGVSALISLLFLSLFMWLRQAVRHAEFDPVRMGEYFAGIAVLALLLYFLRKVNQRAAQAFQQAIDSEPEQVTGVARAIFER